MAFNTEAEPGIVGVSFVSNSEWYKNCVGLGSCTLKSGAVYANMSMTTCACCVLGQFTKGNDGEDCSLSIFSV